MTEGGALADRVRGARGVFGFSKPFRLIHGSLMVLFAFLFPAFLAYVIHASQVPMGSWNKDVWATASLIPASMVIGYILYWLRRLRWEFTDTEIVSLRARQVAWRLTYADITTVEIRRVFRGMRVLWLQTQKGSYTVVLSDPHLVKSVDAPAT